MAIEYTLTCDGCGCRIASSRLSARAARATAQLHQGAYCGAGADICRECRGKRAAQQLEQRDALKGAHSISTQGGK